MGRLAADTSGVPGCGWRECGCSSRAVPFPDLRPAPEVGDGWVRFVQTAGGRPGMPVPRRVRDRPYVRIVGPTVWSTLALTIRAEGSADFEVVGASSFPRHWIYDHAGRLAAKTGLIDFHKWHLGRPRGIARGARRSHRPP